MGFRHHRSIFSTPSDSKETDPCIQICSFRWPSSYFRCHSFCTPIPPPPPPPPPPPFHFDHQSNQFKHISPLVIIIAAILGTCFLLICYFAIFLKYFSSNNNSRRSTSTTQLHETHEDFIDENYGPMVDHPIWFITTVGLEQSVINSIAVCKYKKGDGLIEGTECSVCLNEFQEDENLRLLPKCSHAFHLPCIDTWLRSHTNCPLCRAGLVSNPVGSNSTPMGSNMDNSGPGEEIRGENSESNDGLRSDESVESAVSVHDEEELVDGRRTNIEITKESLLSPLENSEFRVASDLGENHQMIDKGIQPGRRSVSLDFSPASMFCFSISNSLPIEGEGSSPSEVVGEMKSKSIIISKSSEVSPSIFRLMGSSSKTMRMLQKGPVSMKRSLSSGGKFLSSRYGRNWNSILPL